MNWRLFLPADWDLADGDCVDPAYWAFHMRKEHQHNHQSCYQLAA